MTTHIGPPPVLLVEDNPGDVLLFQRAYRKAQVAYPLQVINDGQAAIDYLQGAAPYNERRHFPMPSLVLLDLKLPRKSGHEVLAWIRSQAALRRLPVVILSSSNQQIDVDRAYDLTINSYLVKPATSTALLELVRLIEQYWLRANMQPTINH
jgi:CheY-like chemotaxis protein